MKLNSGRLMAVILLVIMGTTLSELFSQDRQSGSLSKATYTNEVIGIIQPCDLQGRSIVFTNCVLQFSGNGKLTGGKLEGTGNRIETRNSAVLEGVAFQEGFLEGNFYLSWWYVPGDSDKTLNNTKIEEVLNAIPNSSTLVFDRAYSILCNPVFTVKDKNGVTLDFGSSRFYTDKSAGPSSGFFVLTNCTGITMKDLSIVGDAKYHAATDKGEWGMGITIQGCKNVVLENVTIDQCWGDNIYITGGPDGKGAENITISNCRLIDGRRNNVSIINADGVNIQSCTISRTGNLPAAIRATAPFAGIDMEPNHPDTEKVSQVTIKDCHFNLADVGRVGVQNVNNSRGTGFTISGCTFSSMRNAFLFTRSEQVTIEDCIFNALSSNPVVLTDVTDVRIMNNRFSSVAEPQKSIEDNFQLTNVSNSSFENNRLEK